ncbi:MAG: hypothetical protein ACPHCN_12675 [Mycobacterium sp.]
MAALTGNYSPTPQFQQIRDGVQETRALPVYATADEFYLNALVGEYQGKVAPLGIANYSFVGRADQRISTGASSTKTLSVSASGQVWKSVAVTGVSAASDKGRSVFCATDNIADATLVPPTDGTHNDTHIGWVHEYTGTTGIAHVLLRQPEEDTGLVLIDYGAVTMSGVGSFDQSRIPGFRGRLLLVGATVTTVTSDNDAEGIFTPTVNATAVTGALTTTDTAGGTNTFDTVGDTYFAAISGAGAVFTANQEVRIAGTETTAYTNGVGLVHAIAERY